MEPDDVIQMLKDSGLRGRGGAGFPTGMKWGFIPQGDGKPHYLVVNADESEPGTCKDIPLMMANPHVLIEGVVITAYAIRAKHAFIYVRGEVLHVVRRLQHAVAGGVRGGLPRPGHPRLRFRPGASSCTPGPAPTSAARRRRCSTRSRVTAASRGCKPPFPAVAGLYACPTVINNVESIASVPSIVRNGADWFAGAGHGEVQGLRHLLAVRARHHARPVRGAARHHAARAARPGGRGPGRATG